MVSKHETEEMLAVSYNEIEKRRKTMKHNNNPVFLKVFCGVHHLLPGRSKAQRWKMEEHRQSLI